ncbi:DUF1800 domain-containing protein [Bernardetia sp. Wsw4-3y2]|uniref:DUF1800 domain-containing protein n=1 Tax=Bernardetia sp. Wsw4-3y2 TaxID=3127471 RepID=UPI0030D268F5
MKSTPQKIQHLYWRAEFGILPKDIEMLNTTKNIESAVKQIFQRAKSIHKFSNDFDMPSLSEMKDMDKKDKKELRKAARQDVRELNVEWIEQMANPQKGTLREKMTFFWHGHFACELKNPLFAVQQINTIKKHALGNFKDLVLAIAKDAAMILYLNNQQNKKQSPNENFARELMELFTIGRGNYTENDVKEGARAFTGWSTNRLTGEFQFRERQHDEGKKTFMGKTGNFDGTDIIDIILSKKETAHFIATKIYHFFVNENNINSKQVDELTDVFFNSEYDIEKTMKHLFSQDWFYDDKHIGSKIKSPVEFLVGIMRTLDLDFKNEDGILFTQKALGQILFRPPNVAGWQGGKAWIDNATLLVRLNYAGYIFNQAEVEIDIKDEPETRKIRVGRKIDVSANLNPLIKSFQKIDSKDLAKELSDFLIQIPSDSKKELDKILQKTAFEKYANAATNQNEKIKAWTVSILSLPEYQMC